MRTLLRSLVPSLIALLGAASAPAQETTGKLEGRVLDAQGVPIPDVNVSVTSPALQGGRGCLTGSSGTFVLLALPVGEYRVKLAHLAYQAQVFEVVRVRLGQTTTLGEVRLADAVLAEPEIVVKAERPLIDPSSTDVGGVLEARDYSALPIERDYRSAAMLLPGANVSYLGDPINIAGATGQDNRYYVDGIDNTDPVTGTNGAGLPYNFVQEVELRTDGYSAEHRGALGGTLNAITYSGGNEVKVQTFGFHTGNRPAADPRYAYKPNKGDFALYDVGASIGGPIRRDRLWYFLAYNPAVTNEDVEIPSFGMYRDRTVSHNVAGKMTWRASDRHTFVLTAVGDPTVREGVAAYWGSWGSASALANPDVMLTDINTGRFSVAAEARSFLRKDLALRSTLSWTRFYEKNWPSSPIGQNEYLFVDVATNTWGGGPPSRLDNRSTVMDASMTGTWFAGSHELKGGATYRDVAWDFLVDNGLLSQNVDGTFDAGVLRGAGKVGHRLPSAFVQDSWRVNDALRINAGLRWDGLYMVGSDGKVAQTILDQWQPRLGVIWQPGGRATHKLTASAGRFYQDPSVWPLFWYYNATSYMGFIHYPGDPRIDPSGGEVWLSVPGGIQQQIDGLKGQYFDGFTCGYEAQVAHGARLGVNVVYRQLGDALEDEEITGTGTFQFNNPGRGVMSDYPRARHDYTALTLSWLQHLGSRSSVMASYVLSRNRGNYPGTFNSDFGYVNANVNGSFDFARNLVDAYGLLPNDRTHVLKLVGHRDMGVGITLGAVAGWMSGTPLSEFGAYSGLLDPVFLRQRGTNGRTPALWDFSLRMGYQPPLGSSARLRPRVTVDFLHIGSDREPVTFDQMHYLDGDNYPNYTYPNPNYLKATQYQPGPAVRIGAEVEF